jgi:hypothetical protein
VLEKTREVTVRTGNAEPAHAPECASQSCWYSCSKGTWVAAGLSAGDDQTHPSPAAVGPEGTSLPTPYSGHFFHSLPVLCSVEAADGGASLSDLEGNVKQPNQSLFSASSCLTFIKSTVQCSQYNDHKAIL